MTDKARIKIAAGVTALFLAGICAAGIAVRGGLPWAARTADARSVATPAPTAGADASASGEDRSVFALVEAALAAASGEDRDLSTVLEAALAAASGDNRDISAVLDAVLANVSGGDRGGDDNESESGEGDE